MKRLIFTFLSLFLGLQAFAQFGNEWVKFNQPYYKIAVARDGIYRLTYSDLQNAGFPVSTTNPLRIQVFHRGREQAIRITGELDGVFNPADYIEFYGQRNTGLSDAELYASGTQPHPYYNLYSDTTAYFLTVNSSAMQTPLRMEFFSEVNFGLPAETFHTDEKLMLITNQYYTGIRYVNNVVQNTFFETGEGWTGTELSAGNFIDYTITNIVNTSQASGNPMLEVLLTGRIETNHQAEIWVGASSASRLFATQDISGSETRIVSGPLNWSDIGADGRIIVRVRSAVGRLSASYIKVRYPQTFNAAGATEKLFTLNPGAGNKSYVEIQNAAANTQLFDVTDPDNVVAIDPKGTTTLRPVINNTSVSRKIFAASVFSTPVVRRVTFRNINPASAGYVIISNKALMKPASSYSDVVKAYGGYRASPAGGSYDTLVTEMDQLYNQFNYGEVSPLAITRFMRYLVEGGDPEYLFLVGKGLDVSYGYHRNPSAYVMKDLVPTAGMPASDIYFTAGFTGNGYEPAVPTGRITASTPQDVAAYLNKVKELEAQPFDGLWRKNLLHLSGGLNAGEPLRFKLYLEEFEHIADGYYLGGKTTAISKSNTGFEIFNVSDYVNKGLNLITLFGHSSSAQNDVNIGFVSAPDLGYANKGKYPMFLINGCNAGDFFATTTRYGEDWINTPDKGAIGFMANTSFGYEEYLRDYSRAFYSIGYGDSVFIRKGVGDIQKEVVRVTTDNNTSIMMTTQAQQMILLGDPAVSLFGANKPDYETNSAHIFSESYTTDPITALSDSFALKIIVRNFGRAKEDTLDIRVTQTLSDNSTVSYDSAYLPVLYSDTLTFNIPRNDKGFGNTLFTVTIDPDNQAPELNENNNSADFNMLIPLNAARSLYPQGFSIVNDLTTNLIVQSSNALDDARDFIIQLDTVDTFNSAYKKEFMVNGKIAIKEINLLEAEDSLAYYWRVRFAQPGANESSDWSMTSFTYMKDGPEGWAQVHFPQYNSNETIGLIKDTEGRRLEFQETVTDVSIKTFGINHPNYVTDVTWGRTYHPELSVKIGGTEYHPLSLISATAGLACRKNSISLIAFNKTTGLPYLPVPVQYPEPRACGRRPEIITNYVTTDISYIDGKDIMQYITNVGQGDSVVLFSLGSPGYASWSGAVYSKLAELGISSAQLTALNEGEPVVIFARKGATPGSAVVRRTSVPPVDAQSLQVDATVTGRYASGEMRSAIIGPAVEWKKVSFATALSELPQTDVFTFDVIRIELDGTQHLWLQGESQAQLNISSLDAAEYPYLQLVFHANDAVNLTSPQLKNWIVEYTPAPEGVLLYEGPTEPQQLKENETFTNTFGFMNISEKHFNDSLLVQYTVYNKTIRSSDIRTKRISAPVPGATTSFSLTYHTEGKPGLNDVKVLVNPRILPELYYENNVIQLTDLLDVEDDVFNPVLDVTFDGRYLINGDYVAPSPKIVVKVWDENIVKLKTDTAGMKIFLKYPGAVEPTQIFFKRNDIAWFAATSTSDFRIEFNPLNLAEGTYRLQVEAADSHGNSSGTKPYEITFVVRADNSVAVSKAYPNPSQSDVFFQVILTGDTHPDAMLLEITNSNGQVINTFVKGDLIIGTNVLMWQRQNSAGRTVPQGMYIYRLTLLHQGKIVKSEMGKVVLY